jgi:hypothetical protein
MDNEEAKRAKRAGRKEYKTPVLRKRRKLTEVAEGPIALTTGERTLPKGGCFERTVR